ncbi:hypothetical protein EJ03DRAFT_220694 [Teratosphaeria nubilosa]|uniref:Formin binding protein n=1 Tax=Teratosphaeria nubilosa TaxID=161662 RepID=A0A6G1KYC8_9PEZI|nr:hypothetical protein EJ03DRAFT_220694 [Teratosphaeria nubilosa]
MSVWKATRTGNGRVYYYHTETKQTTWEKPADFDGEDPNDNPAPPAADEATIAASWKEAMAADGKRYYYNAITKATAWEMPKQMLEHLMKQERERKEQQNQRADFVAGGGADSYGDRRMTRRDPDREHLPTKPSFDSGRGGDRSGPWDRREDRGGFRGPMPEKTVEPEYATQDQAESAFFKLLRAHNVKPDTPWQDALRMVIRDREYRALKDPRERREAFDKYIQETRAQEKEKEKERKERLKVEFREMLGTHDEIKHYTRWKTAKPMIEREAVYKQAGNEDERRAMFDAYIIELKKKHAQEEIQRRSQAARALQELLRAIIIDPDTRWSEALDTILGNERFTTDETFRALSKLDILNAFDAHIKELDRVRNELKQKEKNLRNRRERKAREGYKQLINETLQQGIIKAGTKWQDFLPHIENEERYLNYLGTSGSSALELFWDAVEGEEHKLRSKRNSALDVLDDKRWEMTPATKVDEFSAVLQSDSRTKYFSAEEVKLIFDRLMDKVHKRAQDEKLAAERHQRKAIDALRSAIKHVEPPVRLGDTYEDVLPRLSTLSEYQDLNDDEARRSAFEKYMRRLKDKEEDYERERERARRDRDRDYCNGSRRDRDDRDRRHRTRTPEIDAYESDRRKAQADRERQYRKPSFGLTPPPRDRRDDLRYEDRRRRDDRDIYDRERRERELERERNYISRADPRDKGRTLDYGDDDPVSSRPGSVRKRRESDTSARDTKRARRADTTDPMDGVVKEEPKELQSGSEEGEIEEV